MTRTRRIRGVDLVAGLAFGVAWCAGVALVAVSDLWQPQFIATWWWSGLLVAVTIAVRRSAPVAGLAAVLVVYPLGYRVGLQSDLHVVPVLLAVFFAVRAGRVAWWTGSVLGGAAVLLLLTPGGFEPGGGWRVRPAPLEFGGDYSRLVWLLAAVLAVAALARTIGRLASATDELRRQNLELVALRAEHARDAVALERVRIARELHDVVAHHIAAILVRAQAAEHVAATDAHEATAVVPWIARTSREALAATRAVVEVLSDGDGYPPLGPSDGEEAFSAAVARVRGAGIDVRATLPTEWPDLQTDQQLALVRITQEALTNVLVHSTAGRAAVALRAEHDGVVLTVTDPGPPREQITGEIRTGHGLANMRERARAAHGTLEAGPAGAGWRVVFRTSAPVVERRLDA